MGDPWTSLSRFAARQAGRATADIIRYRAVGRSFEEVEWQTGGETLGGAHARLAVAVTELRRETWRAIARQPATVLMPPVALAVIAAAWREVRDAG